MITITKEHKDCILDWSEFLKNFDLGNDTYYSHKRKIYIRKNIDPHKMVLFAIRFAKAYGCTISRKVEFTPMSVGGYISFEVESSSKTYRLFYEYGKRENIDFRAKTTKKDLEEYKAKFKTTKCTHPGFKKIYWYSDNWTGDIHEFKTLKGARAAASKEVGNTVTIHTNFPYGRMSEIVEFAPASGHMPP